MEFEQLKLSNQLCFPIYAASRLITREYQPHLEKLGVTYPQYLVLMVLWETEDVTINEISTKLILNTNTLTPLLKRMEAMGLLIRKRSDIDERKVLVSLTEKGRDMRVAASTIPMELADRLQKGSVSIDKLVELRNNMNTLIDILITEKDSEQPIP